MGVRGKHSANRNVHASPHPSSPKYDELKSGCGFNVYIVGFRGSAFWREVLSMVGTGDGRAGGTFCESQCPCEDKAATSVFEG